jgi:hypothetical protein
MTIEEMTIADYGKVAALWANAERPKLCFLSVDMGNSGFYYFESEGE